MGDQASRLPQGCVMLCTDDTGRHVATVTDFDQTGYGGFTLKEAQRIRCKYRISAAVVNAYSSPIIAENMSNWHRDELLNKLTEKGWRVHEIYVGYPDNGVEP